MILGRPEAYLGPFPPPNLAMTTLETPDRSWRRPRSVVGPRTPQACPKGRSSPRDSAGPSPPAQPTGRPLGPTQASDFQVGFPTPQAARERVLRPRLFLYGGVPRSPFPGLGAALTMTAAGRGRVPPAPFPRSPAACRGGGPNCCRCGPSEVLAAPLCSSLPPTSAANRTKPPPAPLTGRSKPAARARLPFYIRLQATPPHGPLSRRLDP